MTREEIDYLYKECVLSKKYGDDPRLDAEIDEIVKNMKVNDDDNDE